MSEGRNKRMKLMTEDQIKKEFNGNKQQTEDVASDIRDNEGTSSEADSDCMENFLLSSDEEEENDEENPALLDAKQEPSDKVEDDNLVQSPENSYENETGDVKHTERRRPFKVLLVGDLTAKNFSNPRAQCATFSMQVDVSHSSTLEQLKRVLSRREDLGEYQLIIVCALTCDMWDQVPHPWEPECNVFQAKTLDLRTIERTMCQLMEMVRYQSHCPVALVLPTVHNIWQYNRSHIKRFSAKERSRGRMEAHLEVDQMLGCLEKQRLQAASRSQHLLLSQLESSHYSWPDKLVLPFQQALVKYCQRKERCPPHQCSVIKFIKGQHSIFKCPEALPEGVQPSIDLVKMFWIQFAAKLTKSTEEYIHRTSEEVVATSVGVPDPAPESRTIKVIQPPLNSRSQSMDVEALPILTAVPRFERSDRDAIPKMFSRTTEDTNMFSQVPGGPVYSREADIDWPEEKLQYNLHTNPFWSAVRADVARVVASRTSEAILQGQNISSRMVLRGMDEIVRRLLDGGQ